jgi:hypothetical protein
VSAVIWMIESNGPDDCPFLPYCQHSLAAEHSLSKRKVPSSNLGVGFWTPTIAQLVERSTVAVYRISTSVSASVHKSTGHWFNSGWSESLFYLRGFSSIGRVRALQARGRGIETPNLHMTSFFFFLSPLLHHIVRTNLPSCHTRHHGKREKKKKKKKIKRKEAKKKEVLPRFELGTSGSKPDVLTVTL